jgi:hypothetical protein
VDSNSRSHVLSKPPGEAVPEEERRSPGLDKAPHAERRAAKTTAGTGSLLTPRWRETDSNHRFLGEFRRDVGPRKRWSSAFVLVSSSALLLTRTIT